MVTRYRAFRDEVRACGVEVPEAGAWIVFWLPMPKSWSKRKRAEMSGQPHQQKPDLDNLQKALLDAIYDDDCRVWSLGAEKRWADRGAIDVLDIGVRA